MTGRGKEHENGMNNVFACFCNAYMCAVVICAMYDPSNACRLYIRNLHSPQYYACTYTYDIVLHLLYADTYIDMCTSMALRDIQRVTWWTKWCPQHSRYPGSAIDVYTCCENL